MHIPPGFTTVFPYIFATDARSYLTFLVQGLGGEVLEVLAISAPGQNRNHGVGSARREHASASTKAERSAGVPARGEAPARGAAPFRKAEDGTTRREIREIDYSVAPHSAARTIAVDREYFDTAEGAHTTDVVEVTVDRITCHEGTENAILRGIRRFPLHRLRRDDERG